MDTIDEEEAFIKEVKDFLFSGNTFKLTVLTGSFEATSVLCKKDVEFESYYVVLPTENFKFTLYFSDVDFYEVDPEDPNGRTFTCGNGGDEFILERC